jgi:hypothetical protein
MGSGGMAEAQLMWEAPAMKGWREAEWIEVHGTMDGGVFRPDSAMIAQPSGAPSSSLIPLGENVVALAQLRPFGIEERVYVREEGGGIAIDCKPGSAPAGLVLSWPGFRLPGGYHGQWLLKGRSDTNIAVTQVRTGEDASAVTAGYWNGEGISLAFTEQHGQSLVLACPAEGASARLDSLMLAPATSSAAAIGRASWVWREEDWRSDPQGFAEAAAAAGFNELAVQVPAKADAVLVQLIEALEQRGIEMRLLDGDPSMATPEGLETAVARISHLRHWLAKHRAPESLMLELDIEPYGQPGFAADAEAGWRGWAMAVRELSAAWGRPVAVDVPWWMQNSSAGISAAQAAISSISEFVVMAYRTDPQLILDAAEPWLRGGKAVQVAIETGPVATEATQTYRRATQGTLRLSDRAVELLPAVRQAEGGEAVYKLEAQTVTQPGRISFHGETDRAVEVERKLSPILQGWPNFRGFRLHGWPLRAR